MYSTSGNNNNNNDTNNNKANCSNRKGKNAGKWEIREDANVLENNVRETDMEARRCEEKL